MPTNNEKVAFSKRLEFALRRSSEPVVGATELSVQFSLRHQGSAVSPQTAHKWLTGRAIPTNDKLATMAKWLNVEEHWLHYGPAPAMATLAATEGLVKGAGKPPQEIINLAVKIQGLLPHARYLVEKLVEQLQLDVR